MLSSYSEDLRLRMANVDENCKTMREVATQFQVRFSFVPHDHQCQQQTGQAHSKPIDGYRRALLEPYAAAALSEQLSIHPSMTLADVQAWLAREHGLTLSLSAIDQFIRHKLSYRYKNTRSRQ
jgi:transposase